VNSTAAAVAGMKASRSDQSQRPARPGTPGPLGTSAGRWSAFTRSPTTTSRRGEMNAAAKSAARPAEPEADPVDEMKVRKARGAAPKRQYFA
jgi:hypothetical protein